MKVVIVGCGRVGAYLAASLEAAGVQVTILDRDPASFRRLPRSFKGRALVGDGTDEGSLRAAGIKEAQAFVAVTQGDNRNIMAAQIAREVFQVPKVICRIYDPLRQELYQELGVKTISPTKEVADRIRKEIEG